MCAFLSMLAFVMHSNICSVVGYYYSYHHMHNICSMVCYYYVYYYFKY